MCLCSFPSCVRNINKYLKLEAEGLEGFFTGQILCIVALICWYLMVAKEAVSSLFLGPLFPGSRKLSGVLTSYKGDLGAVLGVVLVPAKEVLGATVGPLGAVLDGTTHCAGTLIIGANNHISITDGCRKHGQTTTGETTIEETPQHTHLLTTSLCKTAGTNNMAPTNWTRSPTTSRTSWRRRTTSSRPTGHPEDTHGSIGQEQQLIQALQQALAKHGNRVVTVADTTHQHPSTSDSHTATRPSRRWNKSKAHQPLQQLVEQEWTLPPRIGNYSDIPTAIKTQKEFTHNMVETTNKQQLEELSTYHTIHGCKHSLTIVCSGEVYNNLGNTSSSAKITRNQTQKVENISLKALGDSKADPWPRPHKASTRRAATVLPPSGCSGLDSMSLGFQNEVYLMKRPAPAGKNKSRKMSPRCLQR